MYQMMKLSRSQAGSPSRPERGRIFAATREVEVPRSPVLQLVQESAHKRRRPLGYVPGIAPSRWQLAVGGLALPHGSFAGTLGGTLIRTSVIIATLSRNLLLDHRGVLDCAGIVISQSKRCTFAPSHLKSCLFNFRGSRTEEYKSICEQRIPEPNKVSLIPYLLITID